jgi:hypothetical protein
MTKIIGIIVSCIVVIFFTNCSSNEEKNINNNSNDTYKSEKKGKLIPRTTTGDKGKYFLLDAKKNKNIIQVTHKRVGVYETVYSISEIDCKRMLIRGIGESYESISNIKSNSSSKWINLVDGSSKSDLVHFVCKSYNK